MKKTRRSLFTSLVTLLLCSAMFVGSTFAWFTDTVSNTGNKIQAGTLDVELWQDGSNMTDAQKAAATAVTEEGYTNYYDISDSSVAVFNYDKWEPGYSTPVSFAVVNNGNLSLKYQLSFYITESLTGLQVAAQDGHSTAGDDVFDHLTKCNANSYLEDVLEVYSNGTKVGTLKQVIEDVSLLTEASGVLYAKGDTEHPGGWIAALSQLVVKMPETAGNEYENAKITFDIRLLATQKNYEKDGFNNPDYDEFADETPDSVLPSYATSRVENDKPTTFVVHGDNIAKDATNNTTIEFEAGALTKEDGKAGESEVEIVATPILTANHKFEISDDRGSVGAIDLTVTVDGQPVESFKNKEVIVTTYIAKGLSLDGTSNIGVVYKGEGEQPEFISYVSSTGELKFKTKHFSTFLINADEVAYVDNNNTAYKSPTEAFNEVANNGVITMIKDYKYTTSPDYLYKGIAKYTLDLNGYTLDMNNSGYGLYLLKGQTVTINDSIGGGELKNKQCVIYMKDGSNLSINGGHICGTDSDSATIYDYGNLTVNGGEIEANNNVYCLYLGDEKSTSPATFKMTDGVLKGKNALTINGNNKNNNLIEISDGTINGCLYLAGNSTTNISGGNFASTTSIYAKAGTINISGGNFKSIKDDGDWYHGNSGCAQTGDVVIFEACGYPNNSPVVNVTGGTFTPIAPTKDNHNTYGILVIDYDGNEAVMDGTTVPYRKAVVDPTDWVTIGKYTLPGPNLDSEGCYHFTDSNTTPVVPNN